MPDEEESEIKYAIDSLYFGFNQSLYIIFESII